AGPASARVRCSETASRKPNRGVASNRLNLAWRVPDMARKVIIIADPGIDGAFAVALALHDPELDVLALAATPGNVSGEQATHNLHILIDHLDPAKWPRIGEAPAIAFDVN